MTGFEPIIAKNVQKINFKFTMISIFTTLLPTLDQNILNEIGINLVISPCFAVLIS